jgi:tRNA (guanine-N7-)-methyltransferase
MRGKLRRFSENESRYNVLQPGKDIYEAIKGKWNSEYFKNENDIIIELACGRGEYTIGMARMFADKNFIGVDIKGDRIWKGSGFGIEEKLGHVAFLRTEIILLEKFFADHEISDIWITFPDPRPRDRDEKRRLTSPRFLDIYKRLLKPGGIVRLKTDNTGLYEYTLEILQERDDITNLHFTNDLYYSDLKPECYDIRTRYEQKFNDQGHDIKYLRFEFNPNQ